MSDGWLQAEDYRLGLVGDTIVARNAKGRQLKTVPAKAKKTPAWQQLDDLREWVAQHDQEVAEHVTRWLLNSLPVPTTVIAAVWDDQDWQSWLRDLIVVDATDPSVVGLLRSAAETDSGPTLGLVDLDGESVSVQTTEVLIPHPVLLDDLDDLREFAAELGVHQRFDQLYRPVYRRPDDVDPEAFTVDSWAGAEWDEFRQPAGRALRGGFAPRGGDITVGLVEAGELVTASYEVSDTSDPYRPCYSGPLRWSVDGRLRPLGQVGPVAWSEGVRMAEWMYASRKGNEGNA